MKILNILALFMAAFLATSSAFGQELSDADRKIFYETAALELSMDKETTDNEAVAAFQNLADKYGISYEQLQDIMDRGYSAPLTEREDKIVSYIGDRYFSLSGDITLEDIRKICKEAALKYGISFGEAAALFGRLFD